MYSKQQQDYRGSVLLAISLAVISYGTFVVSFRNTKGRLGIPDEPLLPPQEFRNESMKEKPGKGKPVLHGVRVVEWSNGISATARIMAELGAEVIKLELPTAVEPSPTDVFDLGKYSVYCDLRTKQGKKLFDDLLRDADVFVTNIDQSTLRECDVCYDKVSNLNPHIVYAQLTGWGVHGSTLPFNAAAFWAASGLSGSLYGSKSYRSCPQGFGALTASQALVSGICLALTYKLETGKGRFVTSSLLHNGLWCGAPALIQSAQGTNNIASDDLEPGYDHQIAVANPLHCKYTSRDFRDIFVLGLFANTWKEALQLLVESLYINVDIASVSMLELYDIVQTKISTLPFDYAAGLLRESGALFHERVHLQSHNTEGLNSFSTPSFVQNNVVAIPYSFSCCQQRVPIMLPSHRGSYTECVTKNLWCDRDSACELVGTSISSLTSLEGVTFLELLDFSLPYRDVTVSATTKLFLAQGARVIKLEPRGGDPLKKHDKLVYNQFNSGKSIEYIDDIRLNGNAVIQNILIEKATVFITNLSSERLAVLDLDYESVSRRCPSMLMVHMTSYQVSGHQDGSLGAMYGSTGMSDIFEPIDTNGGIPPSYMLDLCSSLHVAVGISAGIFHLRRCKQGQLVRVAYDSIGHWITQRGSLISPAPPTRLTYQLKDGMRIQLLGGDHVFEDLDRTMAVLGIRWKSYPRLFWMYMIQKLSGSSFEIELMYSFIESLLVAAISCYTLSEFTEHVAGKLAFTPVRMPDQVASFSQTYRNSMFENLIDGTGFGVSSPIIID